MPFDTFLSPLSSQFPRNEYSPYWFLWRVFILRIWRVVCGKYNQMKVLVLPFWLCEVVCGQGYLSGLNIGGIKVGGLGLQGQTDGYSVIRFIHWRCNWIKKCYIWRELKVLASEDRKIPTTQLQQIGEILGSNWRASGDWLGSDRSSNCWKFMRNKKYSKKLIKSLYDLMLSPNVMKLCRLTYKKYQTDTRWTKTSLNRSPYCLTWSLYFLTHFLNIFGLLMKFN